MRVVFEYLAFVVEEAMRRLGDPDNARWVSTREQSHSPMAVLRHVPRHSVERLVVLMVVTPLIAYYVMKLTPLIWKFWSGVFAGGA